MLEACPTKAVIAG